MFISRDMLRGDHFYQRDSHTAKINIAQRTKAEIIQLFAER